MSHEHVGSSRRPGTVAQRSGKGLDFRKMHSSPPKIHCSSSSHRLCPVPSCRLRRSHRRLTGAAAAPPRPPFLFLHLRSAAPTILPPRLVTTAASWVRPPRRHRLLGPSTSSAPRLPRRRPRPSGCPLPPSRPPPPPDQLVTPDLLLSRRAPENPQPRTLTLAPQRRRTCTSGAVGARRRKEPDRRARPA
jgi:hypothetical protein